MGVDAIGKLIDDSIALELSGQEGAAIKHAQLALELATTENNPEQLAHTRIRLGDLHYRMGHFEEAKDLGEQALAQAGFKSHIRVDAYILLGNCSMEVGSLEGAEMYYHAAADLSRQIGYDNALMSALHDLGACVYALRGQFDLAFASEEEAFRIGCKVNSPLMPSVLISMCFDCLLTGQHQRSRELLEQLMPLIEENYRYYGYSMLLNAYLAQAEGELTIAMDYYNRARPVAETTGDLGLNVFLRTGLSACHQIIGNYSTAYSWADDAVTWARRLGTRRLLGRALIERANSAWKIGDLVAAESDLRLAIQDLRSRQQAYDLARTLLLLAALLQNLSRPEAEAMYLEAITLILSGGFVYLLERERSRTFPLIAQYLNRNDASMQAINNRLLDRFLSVPPPPLRIITLGRFDVYCLGILIPNTAWRRQAGELFRLLLVSSGRTLSREQIINNLWPDKAPSTTRLNFHQATSSLRRALEPDLPDKFPSRYLIVEEGQVSLYLPEGSQVDYEAFEGHVHAQEWDEALHLYQGEPFVKDRYHDWASWKREELIQLELKALLGSAYKDLVADNPDLALRHCLRVLKEEPWNEQAVLLGMEANLKMKNRPAALQLYDDLEACLRAEFDISPMTELTRLYHVIGKLS
jgi:DNA-binding SARP family transcriptional activator